MSINPKGDILALLASLLWAIYSILTRKIGTFCCDSIAATRHTFFYGIMFILLLSPFFGLDIAPEALIRPENLFNFLFLGLVASALCFVTWNSAVRILGAVKTSAYIYAVPLITLAASAIFLGEDITAVKITASILIIFGLFISERKRILVVHE